VVKARTWFTLVIVTLGTVAATASCGSSDEATGNMSGSGSILSGGASGRAGSTGRAGRAGTGGGSSNVDSTLGAPCGRDSDCADGMTCATANGTAFGSGGPSNGMCTMACTVGGTECDSLKPGAECFDFGTDSQPQGYCLDACELGRPVDLASKCAGRSDFVCADLGDEDSVLPFCVPHCRSDAECGSGLFCDKTSLLGLCSKTKPAKADPVGTACTPGATPSTCDGVCLRTSETGVMPVTGVCAELCAAGFECMYPSGAKPSPGGFCGGQLNDADFGAIDLGYCLPNCSCTSDCTMPGDLCRAWPAADADLASLLGAPGVCYPVVAQSVELSCGAAGAGGAGGDGPGGGAGDTGMPPIGAAGASGSGN